MLICSQLYTVNSAEIFTGRDLLGSQRSRQISVYSRLCTEDKWLQPLPGTAIT